MSARCCLRAIEGTSQRSWYAIRSARKDKPVFHGVFAVLALAYQIPWMARMNAFVFG